MTVNRDDYSMVSAEAIRSVMETESSPELYYKYMAKLETHEPGLCYWTMTSRESDISDLSSTFKEIFNFYPTLPIHLNGMLHKYFVRGFQIGEAKWRPTLDTEPPKDNKNKYIPKKDDFT
jgi:hypothetical protein